MKQIQLILICLLTMSTVFAQDKLAYQLFDQDGKILAYKQALKKIQKADIVLFGELHNNPICHWLQLELTHDLFAAHQQNLVLAAEMFEADDQLVVDEYLQGLIKEKHLKSATNIWSNYDTDYAPLVEFAKTNELSFVASNVPRRYANMVARLGLNSLSNLPELAKSYLAPLPIEVDMTLPSYQKMLEMMKGHAGAQSQQFVEAQAIKDATMAHFILQNWEKGKQVLHFNGSFHSNNYEGIVWYLKKYRPELTIVTIASIEQADVSKLEKEQQNIADVIIAIPDRMTKTY